MGMVTAIFSAPFVLGYLLTFDYFSQYAFRYFASTAAAWISTVLTTRFVLGSLRRDLPLWLIFAAFLVCYYIKFYAIVIWPELMMYLAAPMADNPAALAPARLIVVYELTTVGFVAFCIGAILWRCLAPEMDEAEPIKITREASVASVTLGVGLLLITSAIAIRYGIVMGAPIRQELPFHLRGVVLLVHSFLIPMLLLLFFQYSFENKNWCLGLIALVLVLLYGASNVFVIGSKAGIGGAIISVALLSFLIGRQIRPLGLALAGSLTVVSVAILYPLVGGFREARRLGLNVSESVRLANSIKMDPVTVADMIIMRVTGVDGFILVIAADPKSLGFKVWQIAESYPFGFSGYMNEEVIAVSPDLAETGIWSVAPSLLGTLYVLDGGPAIFMGVFALTLGVSLIWMCLCDHRLRSGPTLQAVFIQGSLLGVVTDGALGLEIRSRLPILLLSAVAVEILCRIAEKRFGTREIALGT